jgi:sarcosine oxidase, subunit alpha
VVEEGAQLVARDAPQVAPVPMEGHVTSSYWSMELGAPFALALVRGGQARHGEEIVARYDGEAVPCRVCEPMFVDPAGERMNA